MNMPTGSGDHLSATDTAGFGAGWIGRIRLSAGVLMALFLLSGSLAASAQEDTTTTAVASSSSSSDTTATSTAPTTAPTTAVPTSSTDPEGTTADSTNGSSTSTTAANARERARAAANLNLAKAADVEIAEQLNLINQSANSTLEKIDEANAKIDEADAILTRTREELQQSGGRQREIEADLRFKAVEGFKSRSLGEVNPILTDMDLTRALRQHSLLAQASLSTAELLEELRGLLEERRLANAEASQAKAEAESAQAVLEEELERLKDQQATQLTLKAEAERRIDIWAGELTAYAKEDAAIQRVIVENAQKAQVDTAVNNPTSPSTAGFQWPINARVSSEFGYRVHPIYRTRRLHAGIDMGAAAGTPIATSNTGVVIFAGRRGGYGNTIIVDHGGGITTLYAHQSRLGASTGQLVDRGDIIGFVGTTGTSTGNHLHFEVRVNGVPTNPRNYLP